MPWEATFDAVVRCNPPRKLKIAFLIGYTKNNARSLY